MNISTAVEGVAKAMADLEGVGTRAQHATRDRDTSYRIRTVYRRSNERVFREQGPGWPRLADSTRERKARDGIDPRPMRGRTGDLYRSLTSPKASDQIDERTNDEWRFGTSVYYARFHHLGEGNPQRKLIDMNREERRQANDEIRKLLVRRDSRRVGLGE